MNNIEKEIKSVKDMKYTKKQKTELLNESIFISGSTVVMVTAMEEIAELIQVLSENTNGKPDYWHTAEEVSDVLIMLDYMKIIFDVSEKEIKKSKKFKSVKEVRTADVIASLATAQVVISKYIRRKPHAKQRCLEAMGLLMDALEYAIAKYEIKKPHMKAIEYLKLSRLEERIMHGTIL